MCFDKLTLVRLGAGFCRYDTPQHIMEEFFTLRMDFYHRRKASLMTKMQNEWSKLDNKAWRGMACGFLDSCLARYLCTYSHDEEAMASISSFDFVPFARGRNESHGACHFAVCVI